MQTHYSCAQISTIETNSSSSLSSRVKAKHTLVLEDLVVGDGDLDLGEMGSDHRKHLVRDVVALENGHLLNRHGGRKCRMSFPVPSFPLAQRTQ